LLAARRRPNPHGRASFGFVSFSSEEESTKAIQLLNGRDVDGREIEVKEAESKPQGDRAPPRSNGGERSGGGGGGQGACYAFQRGECTRGSSCRFSHEGGGSSSRGGGDRGDRGERNNDERPARASGACFAFQKGECTRGSSCRYAHEGGGGGGGAGAGNDRYSKKSKYDDE